MVERKTFAVLDLFCGPRLHLLSEVRKRTEKNGKFLKYFGIDLHPHMNNISPSVHGTENERIEVKHRAIQYNSASAFQELVNSTTKGEQVDEVHIHMPFGKPNDEFQFQVVANALKKNGRFYLSTDISGLPPFKPRIISESNTAQTLRENIRDLKALLAKHGLKLERYGAQNLEEQYWHHYPSSRNEAKVTAKIKDKLAESSYHDSHIAHFFIAKKI